MMKLSEALLLLQFLAAFTLGAVRKINKYLPDVCVKDGSNGSADALISTTATTFKDLVEHSRMFVDKTLLLKSMLDKKSLISLTYPRKWGKTINLDMLKTFVEIEVDNIGNRKTLNESWSYEFFKNGKIKLDNGKWENLKIPPRVSQHEKLLEKYLGKYPVIYIDLSTVKPVLPNFYNFFEAFQQTIGDVFKKHQYLVRAFENRRQRSHHDMFDRVMEMKRNLETFVDKPASSNGAKNAFKEFQKTIGSILEKPNNVFDVLQKNINNVNNISREQLMRMKVDTDKFNKYLTAEGNTYEDMVDSVKFLSRMLNEHFEQPVFVLVNDYDAVLKMLNFEISSQIEPEEARKIENFFAYFMARTFDDNQYLEKGVLSGVFNLAACFPQSASHHVTNYNMLSKNMPPFYGFSRIEVIQLFIHSSIDDKGEDAFQWYSGYRMCDFPNTTLFNPWSVVNFVNNKIIAAYWRRTSIFNVFSEISHHKEVRAMFEAIVSEGADAKIHRNDLSFNRKDMATIKRMMNNDTSLEIDDYAVNLILSYFYATGYLSSGSNSVVNDWKTDIRVRIPNKEIEIGIILELITIYRNTVGGTVSTVVEHASHSLVEFIEAEGKIEFACSELRKDLIKLHQKLLRLPALHVNVSSAELQRIRGAHFLMLLYVKLNYHYDIGFNVLYYEEKNRKRRPYMVIHGCNRGVLIEFNSCANFSWWLSRLTGVIRGAMNRCKEFLSYFTTKNVNKVQMMEIFVPYNHDEVYMVVDKVDKQVLG